MGTQLTLTAAQIRELLEIANPDGPDDIEQAETEIVVLCRERNEISAEGKWLPAGVYAFIAEYPEDGCYGPLGNE